MGKVKTDGSTPFNNACQKILMAYPGAIAVAYKVLDCGCALLCGVSASGDPEGKLVHVSGQPAQGEIMQPICLKCRRDDGLNRVVWEGIYWPGDQSTLPDKDLRLFIGRKIFGSTYHEPD